MRRLSIGLLILLLAGCNADFLQPKASPKQAVTTPPVVTQPVAKPAAAVVAKPKPKKPQEKVCGIEVNKDKQALAQEHYIKGERLFGDDDIPKAKAILKTATCLDPGHKQAAELLQLLEQTYPNR